MKRGNGSSNSFGNGNQKAGNLRNGFRSKSAKPDPTNNKKLHTWADKSLKGRSSVGNLSGRSVKSESGINDTLTKRRVENKKLKPISTKISNIKSGADEIEKIERDKVLKKYGINPNNKSPYANIDKSIVKKDKPFKIKDTYVKKPSPVETDKLGTEGTVETQIERDKNLEKVSMLQREKPVEHLTGSDTAIPPESQEKRPVFFIGDLNDTIKLNERESWEELAASEKTDLKTNASESEESKVPVDNEGTSNEITDTKVSESLLEDVDNKIEKISKLMNSQINHTLPPPVDYKDKIFQLRKLAAREKDKARIERMKKHENSHRPKVLNALNTKPYGFATHLKRPLQQGVGPFQRTNIRTLNSTLDQSDSMHRSGSADLPKISYRHRLQSTNKQDPCLFGLQSPDNAGSDDNGSSSDDFR